MTVIAINARTSTGRVRDHNEDSYYAGQLVAAVADGMGGHAAGEVASNLALQPVIELEGLTFLDAESATEGLRQAVLRANELVLDRAHENPDQAGMGTTLTAALIREGYLHIAHVGDSRAYLYRDQALLQLTIDHTLVNRLILEGHLTEEEAKVHPHRSVITRAIGVDSDLAVDTLDQPLPLLPGDRILLCSDGLSGPVDHEEMRAILANEPIPDRACRRLIDAANSNGGPDNITTIIIDVLHDGATIEPTLHFTDDEATAELAGPDAIAAHVPAKSQPLIDTPPPRKPQHLAKPIERQHPPKRSIHPVIWIGLGLGMLIALLVTGVTVLNSQIYVSVDGSGNVAIYRGLKDQQLFGMPLYSVVETQTLKADTLSTPLQVRLQEGVSQPNEAAARTYINETLRQSTDGTASSDRDDQATNPATPTASPDPASSPTASTGDTKPSASPSASS